MASSDVDALRDDQWARLRDLVPGGREGQRGPRCDNRLFVDALLWMARSGARWRDLPERFGEHQAVKRRTYRWIARGALGGFLAALTADADLEWLMIDSTIVRAHQHAAGTRVAKGPRRSGSRRSGPRRSGPRRSGTGPLRRRAEHQGLHAATDALGNPVRLLFGPGQRQDVTRSHELIAGLRPGAVIADRGYDAGHLHQAIRNAGAEPPVPAKANRRQPRPHNRALYRERNLVERFFARLKQFRRVATRCDKLPANHEGVVQLAAIAILLR